MHEETAEEREERAKKQAAKLDADARRRMDYITNYSRLHRPGNQLTMEKSGTEYTVGPYGEWLRPGRVKGKAARKRLKRQRMEALRG